MSRPHTEWTVAAWESELLRLLEPHFPGVSEAHAISADLATKCIARGQTPADIAEEIQRLAAEGR